MIARVTRREIDRLLAEAAQLEKDRHDGEAFRKLYEALTLEEKLDAQCDAEGEAQWVWPHYTNRAQW